MILKLKPLRRLTQWFIQIKRSEHSKVDSIVKKIKKMTIISSNLKSELELAQL